MHATDAIFSEYHCRLLLHCATCTAWHESAVLLAAEALLHSWPCWVEILAHSTFTAAGNTSTTRSAAVKFHRQDTVPSAGRWQGQSRSSAGDSPAKSTKLTLADSMVIRPASSVVLLSTTQVKTEWDLLDSLFMLVAAVCLFCCPRRSRRAVSSTAGTIVCCH